MKTITKLTIALALTVLLGVGTPVAVGGVGLPLEYVTMPEVTGTMTLGLWCHTQQKYIQVLQNMRSSDVYRFTVPAWNRWYVVVVWRDSDDQQIMAQWIGHIVTD